MPKLYYALVARGAVVLCSQQNGDGEFERIAKSMLPNIPLRSDAKTTYTSHNYQFHVVVENGLIYMCCSEADLGKTIPYTFLNEIKSQFAAYGLHSRAQFAGEGELHTEFSPVLASQMDRVDQDRGDNLSMLQSQVDDVKGVMTQNIEKVLERGECLDDLANKTEELEASSATFKKTAVRVKRGMWCKNLKMKIILACVITIVILVLIVIICFSTGILPPKNTGGGGGSTPAPTPTTTLKHVANTG